MTIIPRTLPVGLEAYARSPDFTPETLPNSLQSAHRTKPGVWGVLHVLEGTVLYQLEAPHEGTVAIQAGQTVVIEPMMPHRVEFKEPGRMFVEFHRALVHENGSEHLRPVI